MPRAASLATKVLDKYRNQVAAVSLVPSSGGAFEISVDEDAVYSKLATGQFPSEGAILADIAGKL